MSETNREDAFARARVSLSGEVWEDWAGGKIEVLDVVEVLWSGWECDSLAALVRLPSGECRTVFVDGTVFPGDQRSPLELLEDRIAAYERAVAETKRFLDSAREAMAGKGSDNADV